MNARLLGRAAAALASALVCALAPRAQPADPSSTTEAGAGRAASRVVVAAPAEGIRVDGVLDEAAWAAAEPTTGFTQTQPTEGAPASQPTEVRVLAGADALYVGARLTDDPAAVRRPLGRRDDPGQADLFLIALDPYNDRRTAYIFGVSASSILFDSVFQNNSGEDESWNAVWDGAAQMTADGWAVEMRIPYSQLRFAAGTTSWGVNFIRHIRRNTEQLWWAPFRQAQAQAGIVQFFGRLDGVGGVRPRRVVQATPYTLARGRRFEHEDLPGEADAAYGLDAGADLKLGLASNVILDLAVNPDFGQVESDPAQLNLTTFETFFDERRPFFLEGTQIFDLPIGNGDGALLYTRRIGAESRILGAAKVSGQTAGGLSFGALGAVTGHDINPDRLYGVARLRRQFGGTSFLGGGLSVFDFAPNAPLDDDGNELTARRSVAAATDWDFRILDDAWKLEGALTGAVQEVDGEDPSRGYALYVGFDKVQGYFTPGSGLRLYSPDFALNDVGRFRQTDIVQARLGGSYLFNRGQPAGPFNRVNAGGFGTQTWRYSDGTNRGFEFFGFGGGQLRNFHQLFVNVGASGLGGLDVRETRGLGPVVNVPGANISINYGTDQRRRLRAYPGFYFGTDADGATDYTVFGEVDWTASDRLTLAFHTFIELRDGWRAWAANEGLVRTSEGLFIGAEADEPDALDPSSLQRLLLSDADADALLAGLTPFDGPSPVPGGVGFYAPVFATRDTRQVSLTARASWLFNPRLSLQLYTQAFAARGRSHDWTLLVGTDDLRPFDAYPKRRDFAFQSFNANAVLRWEYRPGSTLFVVWTQARGDDLAEELLLAPDRIPPRSPFETSTADQLLDTFHLFPDNVLLVKLNYLLMR